MFRRRRPYETPMVESFYHPLRRHPDRENVWVRAESCWWTGHVMCDKCGDLTVDTVEIPDEYSPLPRMECAHCGAMSGRPIDLSQVGL
jgi:hypothetical protein